MRDLASYGLDKIDFGKMIKLMLIEARPRILATLPFMRLGREPSREINLS